MTLHKINCKRRVILTGTPIQVCATGGTSVAHSVLTESRVIVQNDLKEYFSLLNFCNPGSLGNDTDFHKTYEMPILKGRDALATDKEKERGDAAMKELASKVNKLIIRRTNDLLSKYCKSCRFPSSLSPPHQQIDDYRAHACSAGQVRARRLLLDFAVPARPLQVVHGFA